MNVPSAVYWLEEALALDQGAACPPLAGHVSADLCVVGGGYTGLWTAIHVKQQRPDLTVVVVEATGCGFGASGRNGGWVTGWHDELDNLLEHFPEADALWLAQQSALAIDSVASFAEEWGIDCHVRRRGALWAAATPRQLASWQAAVAACQAHGRGSYLEVLDGAEVSRRTGSSAFLGAARHTDAAAVQPALLVRGLRRVALTLGVRIYEGSPMVDLKRTKPAFVYTPAGTVEADQVVLALNSWSGAVRELRRTFVVIGTHIITTEPIGDRLAGTTWAAGELLEDAQLTVHYSQVTPSGRIVFGGGLGAVASGVVPRHFVFPGIELTLKRDLTRYFPQLADVGVTHVWGGPVDFSPTHLPFAGTFGDHQNIHYGLGYSGNGVGPSYLVGKVLSALATDAGSDYATCALARGPVLYFPPDPLRAIGGRAVRTVLAKAEETDMNRPLPIPVISWLAQMASLHTPVRFEPRLRQHRERNGAGRSNDGEGRR
jgi:glycine/D-amino acid oxidase-like deaminating enzyme